MDENVDPNMVSASPAGRSRSISADSSKRRPSIMELVRAFAPGHGDVHEDVHDDARARRKDPSPGRDDDSGKPSTTIDDPTSVSPCLNLTNSLEPGVEIKAFSHTTLDVHADHFSDLALTGRIISATFCLPHEVLFTHSESDPWTLKHRAGMSSLYQTFEFMSSKQSSWKHTLIGWTGEISQRRTLDSYPLAHQVSDAARPMGKKSATLKPGPSPLELNTTLSVKRSDRTKLENQLSGSRGIRMIPVWLHDSLPNDEDVACFSDQTKWRHYTEHELYQVFHYRNPTVQEAATRERMWKQFEDLNRAFTDRILEHYRPGDLVVIHDYQLMLVPAMLRMRVSDIKISYFLHVLFPSWELFRNLSHRKLLLEGMLGADMISFQSLPYVDQFRVCCQKLVLGCTASLQAVRLTVPIIRHIMLENMPLGINNEAMRKDLFESDNVEAQLHRLHKQFANQHVIFGRDRVDGVKGIINKLHAFRELLESYPRWKGKTVLIQIMAPLSIEDCERGGKATLQAIAKEVDLVNARYGCFGYRPVYLFTRYVIRDEYLALLRFSSIGLITSIREGMSTTALEYALAQGGVGNGVLLISEFSGTSTHLTGAIRLNPLDKHNLAATLDEALCLGAQSRAKLYERITPILEQSPLQAWVAATLAKLCLHLRAHHAAETRQALGLSAVHECYGKSARRLLIFDYDGTLTPIVESPEIALPSDNVLNRLDQLAANERNMVWIISGRDRDFLLRNLGHIPLLGLSAEHGSFIKAPGEEDWTDLASQEDMGWRPIVLEAMESMTATVPGSLVECKTKGMTWHYRRANELLGIESARVLHRQLLEVLDPRFDVEIMPGKANLEVRPRSICKGRVVRRLLHIYGHAEAGQKEFVLCVGDDRTDEDMFRALRRCDISMDNLFGVVVGKGSRTTLASYTLEDVDEVIDLLGNLLETDAQSAGKQNGQIRQDSSGLQVGDAATGAMTNGRL